MKRPLYEQEQARKAKTRFRMLQHAQKISHNVSQTCRFIGISRGQYYVWWTNAGIRFRLRYGSSFEIFLTLVHLSA